MSDVVCFVLTSSKLDDRIRRIKNTWANNIPTIFYSDHEDVSQNIVKVSDRNDYWSAEEKQINVVNKIRDGLLNVLNEYKWICFCDDDTFINTRVVFEELLYFNEMCVYGSIVEYDANPSNPIYKNVKIPMRLKYPSGGAGYFVSTSLLKVSGKFKNYDTLYSDVSMGMNFHHKKIQSVNHPLFCSTSPALHFHNDDVIITKLTYHNIKTDSEMEHLYWFTK
jgi:hypothetical protein